MLDGGLVAWYMMVSDTTMKYGMGKEGYPPMANWESEPVNFFAMFFAASMVIISIRIVIIVSIRGIVRVVIPPKGRNTPLYQ